MGFVLDNTNIETFDEEVKYLSGFYEILRTDRKKNLILIKGRAQMRPFEVYFRQFVLTDGGWTSYLVDAGTVTLLLWEIR